MGVALSVCTLPGRVTSDRLGPGKMELGLGIVSYLQGTILLWKRQVLYIVYSYKHIYLCAYMGGN